MTDLLLKRATASPGEVYNVMCEERIVGRIMLSADAQFPWVWTLTYGYHEDRTPTHGYEPTREAAMQAFARELAQGDVMPRMSISSTPRAELDAQHVPAHSAVPKMRVPRSVRLRLRRQGRASQVRRT